MALQDRAGNVTAHLDRLLKTGAMPPADRGLAREIALGALRHRGTLEAIRRAFLKQPGKRLAGAVDEITLVALYQMLFLSRVPSHAAVNEAVNQAARFHHRRQTSFINGLLRSILRETQAPAKPPAPAAADAVPLPDGRWRAMKRKVFPDPARQPAEYLAAAYSLPEELAARWLEMAGGLDAARRLANACNVRAPLIARVNTLQGNVAAALEALAAEGVTARPHANGRSVVLESEHNVEAVAAFRSGLLQPQDPTATDAALAVAARPGERVLDFCAAPGTKTVLLAEEMRNEGHITAMDVSISKRKRIVAGAERMGAEIIETRPAEQAGGLAPASFDAALVDAPCSNSGVLARRAEARWRFEAGRLAKLDEDQRFLLAAAAVFVKPGGRLVYSTCSIEPEENEQVVRAFLRGAEGWRQEGEKRTLPNGAADGAQWHDGGYWALLRRTA